jgi:hypothetical protein
MKMEAACAENRKCVVATARSRTEWVDFFAPASVTWRFLSQIGYRHEKLATCAGGNELKSPPGVSRTALWVAWESAREPARLRR